MHMIRVKAHGLAGIVLAVGLATLGVPLNRAAADVFPPMPFNDMQIDYAISDATLFPPSDLSGFETVRVQNGLFSGNQIVFGFSLRNAAIGSKYRCSVLITVGDQVLLDKYRIPTPFALPAQTVMDVRDPAIQSVPYMARIVFHPTFFGGLRPTAHIDRARRVAPRGGRRPLYGGFGCAASRRAQRTVAWSGSERELQRCR